MHDTATHSASRIGMSILLERSMPFFTPARTSAAVHPANTAPQTSGAYDPPDMKPPNSSPDFTASSASPPRKTRSAYTARYLTVQPPTAL